MAAFEALSTFSCTRIVRFMLAAALLLAAQATTGVAERANHIAGQSTVVSADVCSRHPELFKVRPLRPQEAMRLIRPTGKHLSIMMFERGYVISGDCTRVIKSFSNGILLTNDARFGIKNLGFVPAPPADPRTGRQPSHFVPPANVRSIDTNDFVPGNALSYVQNFGYFVLWSNGRKSVLGTIRCTNDEGRCELGHEILSSSHQIRDFAFLPAPHPEMHSGSLWLQIALPHGEEASVNYMISFLPTL